MRFVAPVFCACIFLFASCAKEEVETFDSQINIAQDFKVDAATSDTFYRFYMPNAFTPNDDGVNDIYIVYGTGWEPDSYEMRIFSREGNMIWYSDEWNLGFDGAVMGFGEYSAQQIYNVDVQVMDTTGELHHYVYKIAAVF